MEDGPRHSVLLVLLVPWQLVKHQLADHLLLAKARFQQQQRDVFQRFDVLAAQDFAPCSFSLELLGQSVSVHKLAYGTDLELQ